MSSQKVSGEQQEPSILSGLEAGFEFNRRNFDNPALEWRRLFSEILGTFLLVLVGAGGSVVNAMSNGQISRAAAVTAPGLTVLAVILFMGGISGAHLNPAVSIAFATRGNFPWLRVPGYIIAQLVGSTLAVLLLRATFGNVGMLGATEPGPGISDWQAVVVEFVLTADLVLWNFSHYWVYLVGPIAGALVAVGIAFILRGRGGGQSGIEAAQGKLNEIVAENSIKPDKSSETS